VNRREASPARVPGRSYTPWALVYAVRVAAEKAGVPHWHPNQLRHLRRTEVRQQYGVEAAQVILGHARADVTQVYAERDGTRTERVAGESGARIAVRARRGTNPGQRAPARQWQAFITRRTPRR